jgi:hypothetical protein
MTKESQRLPFRFSSVNNEGSSFLLSAKKKDEQCEGNYYLRTVPCTRRILRVHGLVGSLAWASDQAGLARSSPAIWVGLGPARKKHYKNLFKKFVIFSYMFLLHFDQYWFVFLYCKDTNPVLKYLVFIKTKTKCFVFMHMAKSLKKNKKSYCIFIQQRKFQKKYVLACSLALIISLLKSRELG